MQLYLYILHFLNQKAFSDQKSKEFNLNFTITSKWNVVYYLWQNIWNKVTKSLQLSERQAKLFKSTFTYWELVSGECFCNWFWTKFLPPKICMASNNTATNNNSRGSDYCKIFNKKVKCPNKNGWIYSQTKYGYIIMVSLLCPQ